MLFDELRYRRALRKQLKLHRSMSRALDEMPADPEVPGDEPRYRHTMGRQLGMETVAIDVFRSNYLVEQSYLYHVPLPEDDASWEQPRSASERILTAAAAQKVRADIRAEQKADWEFFAARITLALALIGSIFGVLAYFKR